MKKAIFTFFLMLSLQLSLAQVSFVGNPDYGQLRNFVYDKTVPNKVYATTYIDKHIMVSNDNGANWSVLYSLPYPNAAPSISEMRLTNNGTALSYIQNFGTGSLNNKVIVLNLQSLSIIKEFPFPLGEAIKGINNYSIYDDGTMNTAMMFTSGGQNKVFYTTTGGTTWTKVFDAINYTKVLVNDAVMDPVNPQKLFIARNGGTGTVKGGLMVSTDAGATWTEKLSGLILQTVTVDPINNNNVYVGTGVRWSYPGQLEAVYKSTDGGETFTQQTGITWETTGTGLKNVPKIGINPNDPNHVVVLADERIAVTTDAGATWISTPHAGLTDGVSYYYGINVAFNPFNLDEVMIANSRFAKFSADRGVTLSTIKNPYFNTMGSFNLLKVNGDDTLLYGVQYGYAMKNLVTNAETPISVFPLNETPLSGSIDNIFVDKNNAGRGYIFNSGFSGNSVNVTNDYGVTSFPIYTTYNNRFTAAETDPTNPQIVWFATFNGLNTTFIKSNFTDPNNPVNTEITLPYSGDFLQGIKFNSANSSEMMITVGNQVWKSADSGTNWTRITAGLDDLVLPNIAISLTQNPLNATQYTFAASNGIYTSLDSGNTWTRIYDQLVQKVEHSTLQNGQIVAIGTSYGSTLPKVVFTNDSGATWQTRTSSDYFGTVILGGATRFTSPTTAEVYLSTNSLGIMKDVISFGTLATGNAAIQKDDISIYPNPTSDVINIKSSKNATQFKVTIYSAAGQQVLATENKSSIDISRLNKGVYLMKIDQPNSTTIVKKMIKN